MGFMLSLIQNAVLELEITLENENNSKLQRKLLLIWSFNVLQKYYKSHLVALYNGVLVYGGATKSLSGNIFLASYSLAFPVKWQSPDSCESDAYKGSIICSQPTSFRRCVQALPRSGGWK